MVLTQAGGRDLGVPVPAAPQAYARERKEQMCEIQGHLIKPYHRPGWKQLCCRIPCCWPYRGRGRVLLLVAKAYQVVKLSRPVQLRSGGCCGRGQPGHQVQERAPSLNTTRQTLELMCGPMKMLLRHSQVCILVKGEEVGGELCKFVMWSWWRCEYQT